MYKHPSSHFGMQFKDPVYKNCVHLRKFIALSAVAVLAVSLFYRHRVKTIEQSSVMPWSALGECTGWSVIHTYYLTYLRESRDKMSCRLSNNVAI